MIKKNLSEVEASATVRKEDSGKYCDLVKTSLVNKGIYRLTDKEFNKILSKIRLRISLTPSCNLWCVFCSNEGSNYSSKFEKVTNIDYLFRLMDAFLKKTPLKSIDFSGGEPLLHPDFLKRDFRLLKYVKKHKNIRFSIHTNGIELNKIIVDNIYKHFSRIGVSVNSLNFKTWNKITNLNGLFSEDCQLKKFNKMIKNIKYLGSKGVGHKVFIKSVVMRGINDSEEELRSILEFCNKYNFHPKFLEFEPQFSSQKKYVVGREELFLKLKKIGCVFNKYTPYHNNPNTYIPGVNFSYSNNNKIEGLHSIFGCGLPGACKSCYDFLCMFVKPNSNGDGLYIKPCSVLDTHIDLTNALKNNNEKQLINLFKLSREYLMLFPGIYSDNWNKEKKYEFK